MTNTIKTAIDNKITELGYYGCRDFFIQTNIYATMGRFLEKDYRRAVRSLLAGENWDDLTQLFLDWKVGVVQ